MCREACSATRPWIGRPWSRVWVPGKSKLISLLPTFQTVAGPTRPPAQCARGKFSVDIKRSERNSDHSRHLVPRLLMNGAVPPLLYIFLPCTGAHLTLFLLFIRMYVRTCVCVCCVACNHEDSYSIAGGVCYCCYFCLRIRSHY